MFCIPVLPPTHNPDKNRRNKRLRKLSNGPKTPVWNIPQINWLIGNRLEVQCEVVDSEINHILPAFSVMRQECSLQREPLLFSCAGHSPKYRRLCPCRDFLRGQVALCRDCL
ncbi:hypothetical protein ILYODFUR_016234 [Ilyodon furcidens]|uniref:alpha-1,6-mannosyl-glycoprotein 6-beta-N-acetylglucosaminyltransferase n=1 Tax=Ilyodon furcidens TaxID=33524 RepID=A0ABV0TXT2_9TELE